MELFRRILFCSLFVIAFAGHSFAAPVSSDASVSTDAPLASGQFEQIQLNGFVKAAIEQESAFKESPTNKSDLTSSFRSSATSFSLKPQTSPEYHPVSRSQASFLEAIQFNALLLHQLSRQFAQVQLLKRPWFTTKIKTNVQRMSGWKDSNQLYILDPYHA